MQAGILGLLIERRFERLRRLIETFTQFCRHDDSEVELGTLGRSSLLELLQIRPRLILVTQPAMSDGTELISLPLPLLRETASSPCQ